MQKRFIVLVIICGLCLGGASARSLTDFSIDVLGDYTYSGDGDYFSGMGKAESWQVGGGISFRTWLFFLDFHVLANTSYTDASTKLSLIPMLGLSVPLSSVSNLEFGFGPSMQMLVPKKSDSNSSFSYLVAGVEKDSVDFWQFFSQSPLYWKMGITMNIGNFSFHTAYRCPTSVSFATMAENHSVKDYFQTGDGSLDLMVSFSLY